MNESGEIMKLNLGTYNIRYDFEHDGDNQWKYRKKHIFEQLKEANLDIIALQEVLHQPLQTFLELEDYDYFGVGRDDGSQAGEYNPIFYRADKYRRLDQGVIWLSKTPDVPSKDWNSGCNRILTYLKLEDKQTCVRFLVLNTHLDNASEDARINQAKIIIDFIENYSQGLPLVLCGDFNAYPDSEVIHYLEMNLKNGHKIANYISGPEGTYNDFSHDKKACEFKKIDYIFVGNKFKISHIATHDIQFQGKYISDHFMITAQMEVSYD